MSLEHQIGNGSRVDTVLERDGQVVVAHLANPAHAHLVVVALVIEIAKGVDVLLPSVEVERVALLEPQELAQFGRGCARIAGDGDGGDLLRWAGGFSRRRAARAEGDLVAEGDRAIDVADALVVISRFGELPGARPGNEILDRYAPDASHPYRTAQAVGVHVGIDLADVTTILRSFGHACR